MRHHKVIDWEKRLQAAFERVDERLETRHGKLFPRHPARPGHGAAARREHDGLFNLGAAFSAGYGSRYGPNYAVEIRIMTLADIPADTRRRIEQDAIGLLREELPKHFPDNHLKVVRDGKIYRIVGDLRLGRA